MITAEHTTNLKFLTYNYKTFVLKYKIKTFLDRLLLLQFYILVNSIPEKEHIELHSTVLPPPVASHC